MAKTRARNPFDANRAVAVAHVRSEQLKGLFLANAKRLLVLLSGSMLFLGVLLAASGVKLEWTLKSALGFLAAAPIGVVTFFFAIAIEGGTLLSASMLKEANRKIEQELKVLDKVRGRFTEAELKVKEDKIKNQKWIPITMMIVCAFFSICGAEIFWQQILESQSVFFHVIGYVLGITCSALLILFEMNEGLVERVIEACISSSALIQLALDQSAKSRIHDELFDADQRLLGSPEFCRIIEKASQQRLYGVLQDAIQMAGITVSAEQLQNQIEDEKEARTAAENFLASGGNDQDTEPLPLQGSKVRQLRQGRETDQRKKVRGAIRKYGIPRLMEDPGKYAEEIGVSRKTLERWANAEKA